jgi:hypothetical protein
LESKEDIYELASFLKTNEIDGVKSVHFFFPNDSDAGPQMANQSRPQESEQDDKWSFCLTAGTLCPANQERR